MLDVSSASTSAFQIINTVASEKIKAFVEQNVKERRDKIYNSDKSKIAILPAFKAAI